MYVYKNKKVSLEVTIMSDEAKIRTSGLRLFDCLPKPSSQLLVQQNCVTSVLESFIVYNKHISLTQHDSWALTGLVFLDFLEAMASQSQLWIVGWVQDFFTLSLTLSSPHCQREAHDPSLWPHEHFSDNGEKIPLQERPHMTAVISKQCENLP